MKNVNKQNYLNFHKDYFNKYLGQIRDWSVVYTTDYGLVYTTYYRLVYTPNYRVVYIPD